MSTGHITIDLDAIIANWRALDKLTTAETGAVVKADGYGLGAGRVAKALAKAGARRFFVAVAEEGAAIRQALGSGPQISVFAGHMRGDTDMIGDLDLTPMLNSIDQISRHFEALPGKPFGIQLDTGMNRLGMEWDEWGAIAEIALAQHPTLVMSHLACADEPDHPMNARSGFSASSVVRMSRRLVADASLTGLCVSPKRCARIWIWPADSSPEI